MTTSDVLRNVNLRPLDGQHATGATAASRVGDAAFSIEQLNASFDHELAKLNGYFEANEEALANRRRQLRQQENDLRVISSSGVDLLFTPNLGLVSRGNNVPVFRYFPPKTNDGIRKFNGGIKFVVMHSFGRGFDASITGKLGSRTVAIDPATGHNPRRFALGLQTLLKPASENRNAIHHLVSLRGDLVNSVSWDNRCVHGEGGGISGINDASIGIEHEEWMVRSSQSSKIRSIEDHAPYSEQQYAVDAFIIKKLEAYTGETFTRYIGGTRDELRANIKAGITGCFNHQNSSKHDDPGAEFFLPPGYELHKTDITTIATLADKAGAWERRNEIWYANVRPGTKISAYDRIFDKVARLRSFDLQTEVFDLTLAASRIQVVTPDINGTYTVAAAQRATRDQLSSISRAEQMQASSRKAAYDQATRLNNAVSTAWARNAGRLSEVTKKAPRMPVVEGAVAFNYTTGQWVNDSATAQPSTTQIADKLTSTQPVITSNTDPNNAA